MKTKLLLLLILSAVLGSACTPVPTPAVEVPTLGPTQEPPPVPTQTEVPTQPEQPVSTEWRAVRDQRYGFGLAVPCWWLVDPIPAEGFGGAMTIKNYDENYFNAHSNKGYWDWPNGTLKLDVIVIEGADPAKSDADAYMQFVDPTMTSLVSSESRQVGANTVTVVTLSNLVNTNDPNIQLFVYRLSPGILLMVNPIPQTIIDTPDFQALLASIVLTPDEQITLPTITPAPALINTTCDQ